MKALLLSLSFILTSSLIAQENDSLTFYYNTYQFQKLVSKIKQTTEKSAREHFYIGKAYQQLGQFNEAEESFINAVAVSYTHLTLPTI